MKYLIALISIASFCGTAQAQLFSRSAPKYSMRNGVMMVCQNGVCTKVATYSQPQYVTPTIVKPKTEVSPVAAPVAPKAIVTKDCDCVSCDCVSCDCTKIKSAERPQKFIEEPKITVKVSSASLGLVLK